MRNVVGDATDEEISIADLARLVVRLTGHNTVVQFDPSKPSGQPRRLCDTSLARQRLGFKAEVRLEDGLARTIAWYRGMRERSGLHECVRSRIPSS